MKFLNGLFIFFFFAGRGSDAVPQLGVSLQDPRVVPGVVEEDFSQQPLLEGLSNIFATYILRLPEPTVIEFQTTYETELQRIVDMATDSLKDLDVIHITPNPDDLSVTYVTFSANIDRDQLKLDFPEAGVHTTEEMLIFVEELIAELVRTEIREDFRDFIDLPTFIYFEHCEPNSDLGQCYPGEVCNDDAKCVPAPKDNEEATLYAGSQLEFCLLTVEVCKEVIPLCGNPGIDNTYCCRSKAFYWPLFKGLKN